MGSPSLVLTTSQLLEFDRRTSTSLGILAQTPVTLGGKTVLVEFMVIEDPLDFNMLLGCDYVYDMKYVVSMLFHVMYFPHNESIFTVEHLEFVDPSPNPTGDQFFPLLIPNVSVDTIPPWVNYEASYPSCPTATKKNPLDSCSHSWDLVSAIDREIYTMGNLELALDPIDPMECLDLYFIWHGLLPSDEVFLESLIQSDLLLDVGSVVTKYNPDFLIKPDISMDQSSYVGIFEFLDSPFEQQVSDPDEFDFSYEFFNSCDTKFVPTDSISLVDFCFSSKVDLLDHKPSDLGTIESSFIDFP